MTRTELILRHLVGGREAPTIGMVAANTGYTRSYVCYLLNGKRQGSIDALTSIAGYLGTTLDALVQAIRHPPKPKPLSKRKHGG